MGIWRSLCALTAEPLYKRRGHVHSFERRKRKPRWSFANLGLQPLERRELLSLSVGSGAVLEGNSGTTTLPITVTLSAPRTVPVSVNYTTQDDTATAGSDYSMASGTLTFAPGQTTQTFNVTIFGDQVFEADEDFLVVLSNPTAGETITGGPGRFTIVNDDIRPASAIFVQDASITEPTAGTANLAFRIALDRASTEPITVNYTTVDDTAIAPADYAATTGAVTFAPGETDKTINVPVNADTIDETTERLFFRITTTAASSIAVIADGEAIGTILDDPNDGPTVSIADASIIEPDSGTQQMFFTVSLSRATSETVQVTAATRQALGGGKIAQNTVDFIGLSETLVFNPGETVKSFAVTIIGDNIYEFPSEIFEVVLSNPTNATILDGLAQGTIIDNDTVPRLIVIDVSQPEGDANVNIPAFGDVDTAPNGPFSRRFSFAVTLSNPSDSVITVDYQTLGETATVGVIGDGFSDVFRSLPASGDLDYDLTGTIVFAPGQVIVPVHLRTRKDGVVQIIEEDETFIFDLFNPVGATIERDGRMTIIDDDGLVGISIGSNSQIEGDTGQRILQIPVSVSPNRQEVVTVNYRTVDFFNEAVAGVDYVAQSGTLVFPVGVNSISINIPIIGDFLDEVGGGFNDNERFRVEIFGPSANAVIGGSGFATATIIDDDGPTITISDVTVTEGNPVGGSSGVTTEAVLFVQLSAASIQPVRVNFQAQNGSAIAGQDYAPGPQSAGTLTFAPGQTVQEIRIPIIGDFVPEGAETFNVVLSNPVNALISRTVGQVTILDDDSIPTISIAGVTAAEPPSGSTNFDFLVTLSNPSSQVVTVQYFTQSGSALAGIDFNAVAGSLTFQPGETQKVVSVPVFQDGNNTETNETFSVNLSNPNNALISPNGATAIGTILVQPLPGLSIEDVTVTEGNANTTATFTVTLSAVPTDEVRVNYVTRPGSATEGIVAGPGVDYIATSGQLVFPANTSTLTQQINVTIIGDNLVESLEDFFIDLTMPINANITRATARGTIQDDDNQPPVNTTPIPDQTVLEDSGTTSINLSGFFSDPENLPLTYTVSGNTNPTLVQTSISGSSLFITPTTNRFGATQITIRATDNSGQFVEDTFIVTVISVNDPPTLNPIANQPAIPVNSGPQNVQLTGISAGANEGATQGQTVIVSATSSNLALVQNPLINYVGGTTATLTYQSQPDQFGTATITVTVTDNGGTANGGVNTISRTFTVTINPQSVAPIAVDDSFTYQPNTPLTIGVPGVLTNDQTGGSGALTAALFEVPQHGKVVVNADGSFTYTPDPGFNLVDTFQYIARNSGGESIATVRLESTDYTFVRKLYAEPDLLNRLTPPSNEEVGNWVVQIPVIGHAGVARAFVGSVERRGRIINDLYVQYMGRPVDQAGLNHWLGVWAQSLGPEPVQAGIIGSPEFFNVTASGNSSTWVQLLYQNILGRSAGPSEVAYWADIVESNRGRPNFNQTLQNVVTGFVTSDEYRLSLIDGWYVDYLNRTPDANGRLFWLNQMKNGVPQENIQIGFLSSFEYRTTA